MRYMHVAIRKNIDSRYDKPGGWEKYGTVIMSGIFMVIMIIGIWFLLDQMKDIASVSAGNLEASSKVIEATNNMLQALDNLGGGSGLKNSVG